MLDDFFSYVKHHENYKWLHWNMRDINYGFAALEHRFRVLKGKSVSINDENLFDLARILVDIYGVKYIEHPRLEKLVDRNAISKISFLSGKDEAEAFDNKEYVKLHQSTLRKVDILANIAERVIEDDLKTDSTWKDMYGLSVIAMVELVTDHWLFKLAGIIGVIFSIISGFVLFR